MFDDTNETKNDVVGRSEKQRMSTTAQPQTTATEASSSRVGKESIKSKATSTTTSIDPTSSKHKQQDAAEDDTNQKDDGGSKEVPVVEEEEVLARWSTDDDEEEDNNLLEGYSTFETQPGAVAVGRLNDDDDDGQQEQQGGITIDDDGGATEQHGQGQQQEPVVVLTTAKVVDEQLERKHAIETATDEELINRIASLRSTPNSNVVVATGVSNEDILQSRRKKQLMIVFCSSAIVLIIVVAILVASILPNSTSASDGGRSIFLDDISTCETAVNIVAGDVPYFDTIPFDSNVLDNADTIQATTIDKEHLAELLVTCPNYNNSQSHKFGQNNISSPLLQNYGIWFTTIGFGIPISASTCRRSNFDTQIVIFRASSSPIMGNNDGGSSCGTLECIAYNDDSLTATSSNSIGIGSSHCNEFESSITWSTQFNETYYLLVGGAPIGRLDDEDVEGADDTATMLLDEGTFGLEILETVENDLCETAIGPIPTTGIPIEGSNKRASLVVTDDVDNDVGRGVWYRINGTGELLTASTCHPNSTFNTAISIYHSKNTISSSSSSCDGNFTRIATNDDACGDGSLQSSVTWETNVNDEYLLLVQGIDNSAGDFILTVSESAENDLCETSIPLNLPSSTFGTSLKAAEDLSIPICRPFSSVDENGPGIWYTYTGTGSRVTVSTCESALSSYIVFGGVGGTNRHILARQVAIYRGSCNQLVCVDDITLDDDSTCGHSSVSWWARPYEEYYIRIYDATRYVTAGLEPSLDSLLDPSFRLTLTDEVRDEELDAIDFDTCFAAMTESDSDGDSNLDFEEYVDFVITWFGRCWDGDYDRVPYELVYTFNMLTCECLNWNINSTEDCCLGENFKIPINGTREDDGVDQDEQLFLKQTCTRTNSEIGILCPPVFVPTDPPVDIGDSASEDEKSAAHYRALFFSLLCCSMMLFQIT